MSDIFSFDLADGLASGQCPLCYALARDEHRWLDSFWREGRKGRATRQRFYAGGGFCRRHAWALHELVAAGGGGAAIADIYGALADRDLAAIDRLLEGARGRRRTPQATVPGRESVCSACIAASEALARKTHFLLELLATDEARTRYERSASLCFTHLAAVLAAARSEDSDGSLFLVGDWRRRLAAVRERLAEFDRKRDHRYVAQTRDDELRSWIDIIRLYVGEPPPGRAYSPAGRL